MKKYIPYGSNPTIPFFLFILLTAPALLPAATVSVDITRRYQTIDGFGASSAWIDEKITDDLAVQFWKDDTIDGHIGLSLLRTRIDPAGYTASEANPMKKAVQLNPDIVVWSTSWTPPNQFKDNNDPVGGNLKSDATSMQGFADYLAKYVKDVRSNTGIDLYAVSCQNEPDADVPWEGCFWTGEQFRVFIRDYWGPTFRKEGITARCMIGESVGSDLRLTDPALSDDAAAEYVGIVGTHLYTGGPAPYPLADSLDIPYWQTEISGMNGIDNSIQNGVKWARQIHDCIARCGIRAYHYWWLVNNNDYDDEGLCDSDGHPTPRMYTLGNFSKFIRPGFVRVQATYAPTENILTSAYFDSTSRRLVVVGINKGATAQLEFDLNGISADKMVIPWLTDDTHRLERQPPLLLSGSGFSGELPAVSVVTFIITGVHMYTSIIPVAEKAVTSIPFTRRNESLLFEVAAPEHSWTLQIVTLSGREVLLKKVPEGSHGINIDNINYSGILLARIHQNGVVKTVRFVNK